MSYRPSTARLYEALGKPLPPPSSLHPPSHETYAVYAASLWVSPESAGSWRPSPALLDAARAAIPDNAGTYAAQGLALALGEWGVRDAEIVAALHPWDAIALHWAADGWTPAQIGHLLQSAGAADPMTDAAAASIAAWIASPWTAIRRHERISAALFGERMAWGCLVDIGFCPGHDVLLANLAGHASPPLAIAGVSQRRGEGEVWRDVTEDVGPLQMIGAGGELVEMHLRDDRAEGVGVYSDRESHWVVTYEQAGQPGEFICRSLGTHLDLETVLAHFELVMTLAGRAESAFRLDRGLGENGEWGFFAVADRDQFPRVAERLHLPLER
jgi:hypothetical protein